MKFNDLVYNIVLEAALTKNTLGALTNKWGKEFTPEKIKKYGEWFLTQKEGFTPKMPQVVTFLNRFDGKSGREFFDPKNLKDIIQYTPQQIEFLYYEYHDPEEEQIDQDSVFLYNPEKNPTNPTKPDRSPNNAKIEASKNLWYGDKYKIVDDGGFRIYEIPNQQVSINFGYYLQTYHEPPYNIPGPQWCTTWWNENNYYANKRPDRYFYFVIDESKHPEKNKNVEISKFYLSALQAMKPGYGIQYKLTPITNPGEPTVTKEELIRIYPKIGPHLDKITFKEFDAETELVIRNIISQINEQPGNRYEFKRMEKRYKKQFIANNGTLRLAESWMSLDEELKKLYINNTNSNNLYDRFSTYEMISQIQKTPWEVESLSRHIGIILGDSSKGMGVIITQMMKGEFIPQRQSISNDKVFLYQSKTTKKFGLWYDDKMKPRWVKLGGIVYEPNYYEMNIDAYFDKEGNAYVVETYSKSSSSTDDTSFYCVFPSDYSGGPQNVDGYFISAKKWNELKSELSKEEVGNEEDILKDFDPETHTDIK